MHRPRDSAAQKTIACVGDSITAGAFSSGGDHPFPQQLDMLLNAVRARETPPADRPIVCPAPAGSDHSPLKDHSRTRVPHKGHGDKLA